MLLDWFVVFVVDISVSMENLEMSPRDRVGSLDIIKEIVGKCFVLE